MTVSRRARRSALRRRRDGLASRHGQRGVALLVAIMLVALGTILAAAMAYNNAMTARRAAATFDFDQALLVAQGAEALAAYGLQQQAQQNSPYTSPSQSWAQPLPPTEVLPGVTLEASLQDLQGRFNINDLVEQDGVTPNTVAIQAFQRLLTTELNLDHPEWADDIVDWIDKSPTAMVADGAEDSAYLELDPPYRTPKLPITSTSELLALPGMTRAAFDTLAPHIVALPIGVQINVCSADPWVLDALAGVVQYSEDPQGFEKDRQAEGPCFPTQAQFLSAAQNVQGGNNLGGNIGTNGLPNQSPQQTLASLVTQTSSWFRLTSFVDVGATEFAVYTLLYEDSTHMVRPVMRSFTPD
ncbi:MAG TPA: type II secretion system minor pseudopilin GspK [Steroidobacteraceae bacterium]|nr:type II secretion system minor pseudopilin GspK [Steroidobacteraceae bacterium]